VTESTAAAHQPRTQLLRNVTVIGELLLSIYDKTKIHRSTRQTAQSTVVYKDHFLHGDLGFKCPKRRLLKNWLKQTATRDLSAQNNC